jgi:hypothetical protein
VVDRPGEQRPLRLVACPRHLVLEEARVPEADVRERIPRIQRRRALEIRDRRWNQRGVE